MKAFISYSHQDDQMLDRLHTHLAQLKREGQLTSWTDQEIPAGGHLDSAISTELQSAQLFIALLSPDYIASNYCYDKEFQKAIAMQEAGKIIIVPIIIEPCDWLSTPFKEFKALPKDGKAVSAWENSNTAFLNIIQNIRKLLESSNLKGISNNTSSDAVISSSRNYRVKKDFDSIEKIKFTEKAYKEVVELLKRYIGEINTLDGIKTLALKDTSVEFECMLVNKNKFETECSLKISIGSPVASYNGFQHNKADIKYVLNKNSGNSEKGFSLSFDDYHMYWVNVNSNNFYLPDKKELAVRDMADIIWQEWLESVEISF